MTLADFAKLVELFDAHKVSFVSVTQAFNTTTSMGRLTLNVLLSFAQFEREVTGERIRDKIAASKQKGLWMGGVVPLGYRVEDRKLVVEETEAKIVRRIFERYLALGSLSALQRALRQAGVVTRERRLATGRVIGAVGLANGALSHILKNRHYLGELNHRGRSWPAEHAPIIDQQLFDAVQAKLAENLNRRTNQRSKSGGLLKGRIFDDRGNPMSPSFAFKKGVRYRYYVSAPVVQGRTGAAGSVARVPAEPIEERVLEALFRVRGEKPEPAPSDVELVGSDLDRVIVQTEQIEVRRKGENSSNPSDKVLLIEWRKPSVSRRRQIILPEAREGAIRPIRVEEQARLVRAIAVARRWREELVAGTIADISEIAKRERRTERSVRMALSLAFLDPAIVEAAVDGRLPRGFGVSRLADLPMAFADQWSALGLSRPA